VLRAKILTREECGYLDASHACRGIVKAKVGTVLVLLVNRFAVLRQKMVNVQFINCLYECIAVPSVEAA